MYYQATQTFAGKPVRAGGWGSHAQLATQSKPPVPNFSVDPPNQIPNHPSTVGFPFSYTLVNEQHGVNLIEFKLCHINGVELLSNYTTEELRLNDYVRLGVLDTPSYFYGS